MVALFAADGFLVDELEPLFFAILDSSLSMFVETRSNGMLLPFAVIASGAKEGGG